MFIYKITVTTTNKCYIGLDTKPDYKETRWKLHCKDAEGNSARKIHVAMREAGLENCIYEVLKTDFSSLSSLAVAEIELIKQHDSYRNGLNSSPGGDGIGKHDLASMTEEEIQMIRKSLGEHWAEYNKKKWSNMTKDEKKKAVAHLHTPDIQKKKAATLKKFYDHNPKVKAAKGQAIQNWHRVNKEKATENSRLNGLKGAAKVSKAVVLEKEDGTILTFKSRSEMQRETGQWFSTLLEKSKAKVYHNSYILKEY
jgi:hypothetical protein